MTWLSTLVWDKSSVTCCWHCPHVFYYTWPALTLALVLASASAFRSPLTGCPWSWKVMEFRKTIFQAWKVMENSKVHGKSWKMMIMSWNFYYCTEQFCKSDTTSFIKSNYEPFYLFNNDTTSRWNWHYVLILVCIHKSIVYLEIYVVPIVHGFSFFGHGKVMQSQC